MQYKLQKGLTLWLTGLSGSGKTTIANQLGKTLSGIDIEILDGDEIREHLCKDLGFNKEDRIKNIERIAFLAGKISKHQVLVIVPVIAPYEEARQLAKTLSENFVLVYIKASLEEVIKRDVKGLYKKALNNEITNFTGIQDPYEAPVNADLIIDTENTTISDSVSKIINFLDVHNYVSKM